MSEARVKISLAKTLLLVALVFFTLLVSGCSKSEQSGKSDSDATADQGLKMEPNHSSIGFNIPIVGGTTKVRGTFSSFDVKIDWDKDDITKSSVTAEIDVASISTANENRDADLLTKQFFDVKNYPKISFVSDQIRENMDSYTVVGDLTMRGVTKRIEFDFLLSGASTDSTQRYLGVSVSGSLNRQDFGVGSSWKHSAIENFIGDEVSFGIDLWVRPPKGK